ncbi:hypothetical protein F5Y15DRAFT_374663 [Xylariaceae sp. FL0016]|nr:hypothetical protein F5Y15DRAFT_374663 [Xylariaceae sp. FL0016]
MENQPPGQSAPTHHPQLSPEFNASGRKRSSSGASLLSKFPFLRTSESKSSLRDESRHSDMAHDATNPPPRALATISQQQKTRRRKGSLRKVALLGRGAARERREIKPLAVDAIPAVRSPEEDVEDSRPSTAATEDEGLELGISDVTPRPSMEGYAHRATSKVPSPPAAEVEAAMTSPSISYTSTTDEEDVLSIPIYIPPPLRPDLGSLSSGSDSYFPNMQNLQPSTSIQRRRSVKHAKSPLSLQGLSASPLPTCADEDHDYSETEWWGWVVLAVTWFVFIIGMGSCLNIWTWAWDVGTTPYAPPELEDDPTLPIVGYYPALLILTCIMAWVWVLVAWLGMKYFRHAKITGD